MGREAVLGIYRSDVDQSGKQQAASSKQQAASSKTVGESA
jgi:hypothetical protein